MPFAQLRLGTFHIFLQDAAAKATMFLNIGDLLYRKSGRRPILHFTCYSKMWSFGRVTVSAAGEKRKSRACSVERKMIPREIDVALADW